MVDEVKKCVDAKINFFEEFFSVPNDLKSEMEMFIKDTQDLGEKCSSASEFEEQFSTSELLNRFNTLVSKCTPKAKKMTKEEKKQSVKIAKEILNENKEEFAKDALRETTNRIINDKRDEMLAKSRERMLEDGTFDDYTIMRNRIHGINDIVRFIGNIFRKKVEK